MTHVLAKSAKQFDTFIKNHKLNRRNYRYIKDNNDLLGTKGTVIVLPDYLDNPNYDFWFTQRLQTYIELGYIRLLYRKV